MKRHALPGIALAIWVVSCAGERAVVNNVVFAARDDNQHPVAGVSIQINGKNFGQTNTNGDLPMRMTGPVGASFEVQVMCPEPFHFTGTPPHLVLNAVASASGRIPSLAVNLVCERPTRDVAILVHAVAQSRPPLGKHRHYQRRAPVAVANMPILHNGQEVARTDQGGLAHLTLSTKPGEMLELVLDTASEPFANLRPRSPLLAVEVKTADNIYVLESTFNEDLPPPPKPKPARPKHVIKFFAGGGAPLLEMTHGSKNRHHRAP